MRIKQKYLPCFLLVVAALCFVFITPAFSEFRKVNECELARTNASVTGHPIATQCYGLVDEDSDCNPEDAFKACPGMMSEGETLSEGGSLRGDLYSPKDEEEDAWLQKAQDFLRIYDPIYNPLSPISVEAGTLANGEPYITIGLGSQEVGLDEMDILVTLGGEAAIAAGEEQILGSLYLAGLRVKTEGSSYVTLYKKEDHMGLGVNVDAAIERIALDTLSWGDADGFPMPVERVPATGEPGFIDPGSTGRKAGYVGLKDTVIDGVTVSGPVSLDVETVRTGETSGTYAIGTKYIHIGLDNLDVGVDSIDTTAVVGDKKNFSGDTGVLGTLYLKELNLNVTGHLDLYNDIEGDIATLRFDLAIPTLTLDTLAWGDPDGIEEAPYMGGVGLRNLSIRNLDITGGATIDTATAEAIGEAGGNEGILLLPPGTVFVGIGLSNLDIRMESLDTDVALGNAKDNLNQVLGSVYLGDLKMVMDGTVKIHTPTASTQGIVLDLDVKFQQFFLGTLSWGDTDGIGLGAPDPVTGINPTAGYVGLRDLTIDGLKIFGRVTIDVATVDSSAPINSVEALMYSYYDEAHHMSPSFVHIGLGTGNPDILPSPENGMLYVGLDSLSTSVVLGSTKTLRSKDEEEKKRKGTLGMFYTSGVEVRVNGWVDIGSHNTTNEVYDVGRAYMPGR